MKHHVENNIEICFTVELVPRSKGAERKVNKQTQKDGGK
jgi:hypothetical protein